MTVHNIASASGHGTMVGVSTFIPSSPLALAEQIATLSGSFPSVAVVAIDGPDCAQPSRLAELVGTAVESRNRPSAVVSLHDYVRPASLRYEFGHEDALSYRTIWFDYPALDREVITAAPPPNGRSCRNSGTNPPIDRLVRPVSPSMSARSS